MNTFQFPIDLSIIEYLSLKDVKSIKGNKKYSQLIKFIDDEEIIFVPFSDNLDTWSKAHSFLFSLIQILKNRIIKDF